MKTKEKKKLIVFDIDGTLIDSVATHREAFLESLRAIGVNEVNTNWAGYKHHTDSYILKACYESYHDEEMKDAVMEVFEEKMVDHLLAHADLSPMTGAREFIEYAWNETEYAITFATGSLVKPAIIKLVEAGIPFTKELVIGSNQHQDRESIVQAAIKAAAEYFQVDQFENITAVGDGIWDLVTANNLNIGFVGVGEENKEEMEKQGMKSFIKDFSQLN